jgi:hypothetical protein
MYTIRLETDYTFAFSKTIMCRNAFTGAIVYGKQQLGKTSYTMQVAYDIYQDWDMVFENMFFSLGELVGYLREHIQKMGNKIDKRLKIPFVIWDDAGVHANKMMYFNDPEMAQMLASLFDVVGAAASGIALSTPTPGNLLRAIRDYEFLKIKISKDKNPGRRVATAYAPNLWPSGKVMIYGEFDDHYPARLPDDVYNRYQPIRMSYLADALERLDEIIEKRNLKNCVAKDEMAELKCSMGKYA